MKITKKMMIKFRAFSLRLIRMGKCLQRTGKCRAVSAYGLHDAAANVYGPHSADAVWPVERVYI